MTKNELLQLLEWRKKRGYTGLNLRQDGKAWVVALPNSKSATSRNFAFNAKFDMHVLWALDEACKSLEEQGRLNNPDRKMFGHSRVSKVKKSMVFGNDLIGVSLEAHHNGLVRAKVGVHMEGRLFKLTVPAAIEEELAITWSMAFARQIRALSFEHDTSDLTDENVKKAWKEFKNMMKSGNILNDLYK